MSRPAAGAVVTGAGRGLGRRIAGILVERGHQVLLTDRDGPAVRAAAAALGDAATAMTVDVRDPAQVDAARDAILERAGRLDVWVNNAGVLATGPAWSQEPSLRTLMIEVNAVGTINGTVAAIDAMRGRGGGHIVNIVSLAGLTAVAGEAVYAASKHAALGFSLSTLADLRAERIDDIRISCVCPDGIWTPMLHDKLEDPASALSFSGKLLRPDEVADAVRKVLERPRPVTAVPGWRGVLARLADAAPALGLRAVPLMAAQGRRTQRRLLSRRGDRDTSAG
ncbi:SDR family NAD(P)-dependent oxidoreductase [Streptomyces sp. SID5785]|uniref:SDR family oxidoreductase n=1 Tax=Streptomyces sp. SID5785 TaxID=2690309 RepID=UPI001360D401|nr:SDR family oxidoreductase [Streptomyces sp. SID5785]MZD09951.1 SDR family NAD(P)-dependent oxidoreductase [Streptomyces sp. SID5785]